MNRMASNSKKGAIMLASAAAGLLTLATTIGLATPAHAEDVECYGVNKCKGQGECSGKGHSCAGKNECAGKGWVTLDKEKCVAQGGRLTAEPAAQGEQKKDEMKD
jgi:uncharacterized membrane protein